MTLYWWMHWFWITALHILLSANASVSQTVPTVQNGHQNGPYSATALLEDRSTHKKIGNQHEMNIWNFTLSSTERSTSQNKEQQMTTGLTSESPHKSGPASTIVEAEGEHTLPAVLSRSVDLLHLEAKVQMPDYSQFPQVNGHESYEQNWDHFPASQWDTSSAPYEEELENITSSLATEETKREDESIQSNNSKSRMSNRGMDTGDDQPVNDEPHSDGMDVFNISDGISPNVMKTSVVTNATTDSSPVNKPVGYNYRGKYVNMEKKMQDKPRNMTSSKTKTGSTPIVYVTPTSLKIVTEAMKESGEENVTESNNHIGGVILSKDNISITLPANESLAAITPDPNIRNLATTANNTNNDSVLSAVSRERIGQSNDGQGLDAASITGIALGILASAVLVGAFSVVLYRRRYLNKPQTLNDSNPDSSGYLDENTLRENSEEMYSLDNDSFLNSLEAMTIQNYWTDSVKHTKL